jgi:hypothetical protein
MALMASRGWVAGAGVIASAAVAALIGLRGRGVDRSAQPQADLANEVSSLREQVAELRLLATRVPAERITVVGQTTTEKQKPAKQEVERLQESVGRPTAARLEEVKRRSEELQSRRFKVLDERMTKEQRDDVWATSTERAMRNVLAAADFSGNRIDQLECRSALCKITVTHADPGAEQSFSTLFLLHMPDLPNALFLREVDGQGQAKTAAFLTRDPGGFSDVSGDHLASSLTAQ